MADSLGVFIFPWPCVWPPAAGSAAAAAAAAAAGSALKLASAGSAVLAGNEVPADCAAVHGTGVCLEDIPVDGPGRQWMAWPAQSLLLGPMEQHQMLHALVQTRPASGLDQHLQPWLCMELWAAHH